MEVLFFLLILLGFITLLGHGIWLVLAFIFRAAFGAGDPPPATSGTRICPKCGSQMGTLDADCHTCVQRQRGPESRNAEFIRDIATTERIIDRLEIDGRISESVWADLKAALKAERGRVIGAPPQKPAAEPATATPPPSSIYDASNEAQAPVTPERAPAGMAQIIAAEPPPIGAPASATFMDPEHVATANGAKASGDETRERQATPPWPVIPAQPSRPFSEVLAAFMEQSNIRWGEIVGGLLIIGCSTALVVSLWNEISQIPILKFLIFTTVTAALFGVGLYTEHYWKLPTTSRGILTIATLLVPLNFLAIAAVSGGALPAGPVLIASEVVAPLLFFWCVLFAGRVIAPKWPGLLVGGVLVSSIGQLLVRHFSGPDSGPLELLAIGLLPILGYTASTAWMLKRADEDSEITEPEANAIFVTLGAATFAAILPFGLLLFKTGHAAQTLMQIAPLLTLAGMPMLGTGLFMWDRLTKSNLAASRTAGTAIAIIGALIVGSSIYVAWPNPASVVFASLFAFGAATAVAFLFNLRYAHLAGAICFSIAFYAGAHAFAGDVPWQISREGSLLSLFVTAHTAQSFALLFALMIAGAEWLGMKRGEVESRNSYLAVAAIVGIISFTLISKLGFGLPGDPYAASLVYTVLFAGTFWTAYRMRSEPLTWTGSGLLFVALAQFLGAFIGIRFPWQTAALAHSTVCAAALILFAIRRIGVRSISRPLEYSAYVTSCAVILMMVQAARWEPTALLASRVFWLAGVWLLLLWTKRSQLLFNGFQAALAFGVVLSVKASLATFDWYAYSRNATLNPWSLQIHGIALALFCLSWIGARIAVGRYRHAGVAVAPDQSDADSSPFSKWAKTISEFLESRVITFDQALTLCLVVAFNIFCVYAAVNGVRIELAQRGTVPAPINVGGFPHTNALGIASWILFGLLLLLTLSALRQLRDGAYLLASIAVVYAAVPLVAGYFEGINSTASAWRWLAAVFLLSATAISWFREPLKTHLARFSFNLSNGASNIKLSHAVAEILLLALAPIALFTAFATIRAINYRPPVGPTGGLLYQIGETVSYTVPLALVAIALAANAWRQSSPRFAFAAAIFCNLAVTVAHIISVMSTGGSMNRVVLAEALQYNAITAAMCAILWLSTRKQWRTSAADTHEEFSLLRILVGFAIASNAVLILPVAARLITHPDWAGIGTAASGGVRGWVGLGLCALAGFWLVQEFNRRVSATSILEPILAAGILIAFGVAPLSPQSWLGYHTLLFVLAAVGWLMVLSIVAVRRLGVSEMGPLSVDAGGKLKAYVKEQFARDATVLASLAGAFAALLALIQIGAPPGGYWWSIGILISSALIAASLNWVTTGAAFLYFAGLLLNIAASIWWLRIYRLESPSGAVRVNNFLSVNVIALALPGIVWTFMSLRARERRGGNKISFPPSFHHLAVWGSLFLLSLSVGLVDIVTRLAEDSTAHGSALEVVALVSTAGLILATLYDKKATYAVGAAYLLGLIGLGLVLDRMALQPYRLIWAGLLLVAGYTVLTSYGWRRREEISRIAENWWIPRREIITSRPAWLPIVNLLLAVIVLLVSYKEVISLDSFVMRAFAALAVCIQILSFGFTAESAWRTRWLRMGLSFFCCGIVFLLWSWLVPGVNGTWLNRAVLVMIAMLGLIAADGIGSHRIFGDDESWKQAAKSIVPYLAGIGAFALFFVLGTEIYYQESFGIVRINAVSLATVAITLVSAVAVFILFAVSAERDPLKLSERGRMRYVYVAEGLLALLFLHIRLTMPWLFTGFFSQYWPLVIVAIAFIGVGLSEVLRRQGIHVLAVPIERTGALLPLLPVIGFWIASSTVDYSTLLFAIGLLYAGLSILRQSFGFGLLAALAGNGGLWHLLHSTESFGFFQHPQLWLIPFALSILIAAHINRDRFTEEQMTSIRYVTLMMVYVSSTADVFINGVATSPWLPLVLAGLSVAGVFCGVSLRVRAFLYLGSFFLLISVITMIWYASANLGWTWLWYVAGITVGVMIIFTFAIFEKKRTEMVRLVDGLREWQR